MTTQDAGESLDKDMAVLQELQRGFKTEKLIEELRTRLSDARLTRSTLGRALVELLVRDEMRSLMLALLTPEWIRYRARRLDDPTYDVYGGEEPSPMDFHRELVGFANADEELLNSQECRSFLWRMLHQQIDTCTEDRIAAPLFGSLMSALDAERLALGQGATSDVLMISGDMHSVLLAAITAFKLTEQQISTLMVEHATRVMQATPTAQTVQPAAREVAEGVAGASSAPPKVAHAVSDAFEEDAAAHVGSPSGVPTSGVLGGAEESSVAPASSAPCTAAGDQKLMQQRLASLTASYGTQSDTVASQSQRIALLEAQLLSAEQRQQQTSAAAATAAAARAAGLSTAIVPRNLNTSLEVERSEAGNADDEAARLAATAKAMAGMVLNRVTVNVNCALEGWAGASAEPCLQGSLVRAARSDAVTSLIPLTGEAGKVGRKELAETCRADTLLDMVPEPGDVNRWPRARGPTLERWLVFAFVAERTGDGEAALLTALQSQAQRRDAKQPNPRWEALFDASSLRLFVVALDSLFRDPNCSLEEARWTIATDLSLSDTFYQLQPLMKSASEIARGRQLLTSRLEEMGRQPHLHALAVSTLAQFRTVSPHQPHAWETVLQGMASTADTMGLNAKGAAVPPQKAAHVSTGSYSDKTTFQDTDHSEGAKFSMHSTLSMDQANRVSGLIADDQRLAANLNEHMTERQDRLETMIADLAQMVKGAVLKSGAEPGSAAAVMQAAAAAESLQRAKQLQTAAALTQSAAASVVMKPTNGQVWNLAKIYAYLGISPVPPTKGTVICGKYSLYGCDCLICSECKGFTQFEQHEVLLQMSPSYPKDIRAYHNAWTCRNVEEVVRAFAAAQGTPADEIAALLAPIDKPWK